MKLTSARSGVGLSHGWPAGGWPEPQVLSCSAPAGGWKTTMSPTWGFEKRMPIRFTRTRWPTSRVGTIDSDGMRYGLTRKAWMARASPSATATIRTISRSEPPAEDPRLATLPVSGVGRLGGDFGRRLIRRLDSDPGDSRRLGGGRCRAVPGGRRSGGLGSRVVQQAALDDLLRTDVPALAHARRLADAAAQVVQLG